MPIKHDDATTGEKLLRLFQRLMLDGRRHFQQDPAEWLNCSQQTVIRLTAEVEGVIGTRLQMGIEGRRRWYQIVPVSRRDLGLDYAELRYLRLCRELADPYLPQQIKTSVDEDFAAMTHPTNLAVHRIIDAVPTSKPVTFDLPDADPGAFGLPRHDPCTYRIKFAPGKPSDYVRERVWAETQTMETAPDGGAVLTVTTRSKPELLAWVRSFGEDAQLLDSPSDPQA